MSVEETETSVSISKSKLKKKIGSLEKAKSELNNSISNRDGAASKLNDSYLNINKLKENLDDKSKLFEKKFISKKELEDAKFEYERQFFNTVLWSLKFYLLMLLSTQEKHKLKSLMLK